MFEKLHELVSQVSEGDFTIYKNASKTRKLLQEVRKEAQACRLEVLRISKEARAK